MNQETRAYLGMMEYARALLAAVIIGSIEPEMIDPLAGCDCGCGEGCNDAAGSEVAQVRKPPDTTGGARGGSRLGNPCDEDG